MQRYAVLIMTMCAAMVQPRPAYAQSNPGIELTRTSWTSVRQYVATDAAPAQPSIPPNLVVPDDYRTLLDSMLRASPTFRRQCLRIAGERKLTVFLALVSLKTRTAVRATTLVTRHRDGRMSARIELVRRDDIVELVAHEFEHIIEQLDGVDLAAHAARPSTGVHAQTGQLGLFETARAKRMGRLVATELRGLP